jgi:hypothetical protein
MALWFATIALLGIWGISGHPSVLIALDPRHALGYLISGGATGFLVLGGVFLCVTGAEALYADMGHFGAGPIKLAWSAVVFPSLVLNYAGQAPAAANSRAIAAPIPCCAPVTKTTLPANCMFQLPLIRVHTETCRPISTTASVGSLKYSVRWAELRCINANNASATRGRALSSLSGTTVS